MVKVELVNPYQNHLQALNLSSLKFTDRFKRDLKKKNGTNTDKHVCTTENLLSPCLNVRKKVKQKIKRK